MKHEHETSILGHLNELRKRLIIIVVMFFLSLGVGLWLAPKMLQFIKSQSVAKHIDWNVFAYSDGLMIYLKCALFISILITLPIALHQLWLFVKPGLTEKESKGATIFIPLAILLFIMGASFSYFILFPLMLKFMAGFNQSVGATEMYGLNEYFTFMFNLVIPIGLIFELPVLSLFLTRLGIVTPQLLRRIRKVSYFVLVVIGMVITPPELVSELLIIIPLFLLFEISILFSAWSTKQRKEKDAMEVL